MKGVLVSEILLVGVSATSAHAQAIRPRFDWPVGSAAVVHVLYNLLTTREHADTSKTVIEARYELSIRAAEEGRLILWGPPESRGRAPAEQSPLAMSEQLYMPSFVVTAEGDLVRLHATEDLRRRIAHDTLRARLTDQRLFSTAEGLWVPLVMSWTRSELELGRSHQTRERRPVPFIPGSAVDVIVSVGTEGHVPCRAAVPGDSSCVRVVMHEASDTAQMAEVLRRTAPLPGFAVRAFTSERFITLVTDPGRLRPYQLEVVYEFQMTSQRPGQPPESHGTVNAWRWVFEWPMK